MHGRRLMCWAKGGLGRERSGKVQAQKYTKISALRAERSRYFEAEGCIPVFLTSAPVSRKARVTDGQSR